MMIPFLNENISRILEFANERIRVSGGYFYLLLAFPADNTIYVSSYLASRKMNAKEDRTLQ